MMQPVDDGAVRVVRFDEPALRFRVELLVEEPVDAGQDGRHEHDRRDAVRDAEIAPLDPVVCSKAIGDGEGRSPEGSPEWNDDRGDQHEQDGFAEAEVMER